MKVGKLLPMKGNVAMSANQRISSAVSRWAGFDRDKLIRHSLIVFIFTHTVSVANMLFQMVMGWNLSVAEFGVLSSMLGLMMAIATPMAAIQNTLAHYSANLIREGRDADIHGMVRQWANRIILISIPLLVLLFVLRNPLSSFFHLATPWPLLLVGLALFVSSLSPIFGGALQGRQAFVLMGVPGLTGGIARLLLGGFLVFAIAPEAVCGLSAHALGALCGTVLVYLFYRISFKRTGRVESNPERSDRYFWASLTALFSFSILMNMDVVLVKHYFKDPADFGNYARASTIARSLVFLIQPVAGAMFPKVTSRGNVTDYQRFTFIRALALATMVIAGAVLLCTLFPGIPLLILYRDATPTPQMIALARMVCWAMAPLGLVFMLMNFELARRRMLCALPLAVCAAAFLVGVALFHASLWQVIIVFLAISLSTLLVLIGLIIRPLAPSAQKT